jgi:hypothetical protein
MSSSDSSFSVQCVSVILVVGEQWADVPSSFFSSSAGAASPPAAAPPAPPAAGAAAAPPPEPTFRSKSLTSLPSRACPNIRNHISAAIHSDVRTLAKRVVQMGSTSSIFAALISDWSLSAWHSLVVVRAMATIIPYSDIDTVIGKDESGVGGCELRGRHCDVGRNGCRGVD